MRDILPGSNLSLDDRNEVAKIVHDFIRWKKLYDIIIEERDAVRSPEIYVRLVLERAHENASSYPFEYKYSLSKYLTDILKNREDIARYLNEDPPTTLCVNFNKSSPDEVIKSLNSEGLDARKSVIRSAVISSPSARYSSVINEKKAHVQDESSQMVSLITVDLGDHILDFCAGNGGKALSMASLCKNEKNIHCYDIDRRRLNVLKKRCKEYNAKVHVDFELQDVKFDAVLVDAPCTGVGAARRNPEAKYVDGPGKYPQMQLEIMMSAYRQVRKGGYLIYTVCAFTPEETNDVVRKFIESEGGEILKMEETSFHNHLIRDDLGYYTQIPDGDIFYLSVILKD